MLCKLSCAVALFALSLAASLSPANAGSPYGPKPMAELELGRHLKATGVRSAQIQGVATSPLGAPGIRWFSTSSEEGLRLEGDLPWRAAKFLALDAYYDADHAGMLEVRFYARGEAESRIRAVVGLFPRLATRVVLPLSLLAGQVVYLPATPVRLKGVVFGRRLDPAELSHAAISLAETGGSRTVYLSHLALLSEEPAYPVPAELTTDELGQWTARDWPGKTPGEASLRRRLEEALAQAGNARYPRSWSRYGGWREKRFSATGFFRTEHDGKRWWLVDPEGNGFFSAGLDCVRSGEGWAVLGGMERLFRWIPVLGGPFAPAVGSWFGIHTVDFGKANLIRAFGESWRSKWRDLTLGRLVEWRFNTVGNWSDLESLRPSSFPYVLQLENFPTTRTLLFRDFPDVFAPEYRESSRAYADALRPVREDPFLVGYFMSNEPHWGFGTFNVASEMLEGNAGTASRRELERWLRDRYRGDQGAWSRTWNRELGGFDRVVTESFHRLADTSPGAEKDLWEFSREMVRAYVRVPSEELRRVDPNHLNLGMRFASISSDLLYDAGQGFDVFSINCYESEPALRAVDEISERVKRPVLIGEFHFGALDRGLPATGLKAVASQLDRGLAYRRYMEKAAANRNLVGAHYFMLNDQPLLGRFDGENYQIGFVDVCHAPYSELVEQASATHESLYEVVAGLRPPFGGAPRERPPIR